MVLVGYGSNNNRSRHEESWIGWFAIPIASIFIRDYYLEYTNFQSLGDRESVAVSLAINVHTLRNTGKIKAVSVLNV